MKRILFSDNGTLIDFTTNLNNYHGGTKTFNYTTAQDALYIGSKMAFNHLYFKLSSLNLIACTMTVQYWNGNSWENVVELIDETSGLTVSGFITFTPNKNSRWQMSSTNDGGDTVDGLTSVSIYDQYWLKITFNQTLTNTTAFSWVGNKFCEDEEIYSEYPDFAKTTVKTSIEAGKTTWEEQIIRASSLIEQDLIDKGIIYEVGQILNRRDYTDACISKTSEIIFRALGDDFQDQRQQSREEYQHRLSKRLHNVDTNADAIEQIEERRHEIGFLRR